MNRLKEIRNKKGLTQKKLAEVSNVPSGTISMIESGERTGKYDTWEKLAKALEVTIHDLTDSFPKNENIVDDFIKELITEGLIDAKNGVIEDRVADMIIKEIEKKLYIKNNAKN